jgi:pimeloyl-ACP methyl ester carboxylesterase
MGFGLSEKPQNQTYSIETYVSQLTKFIENFHLEHVIIAGHDIGAPIAALYTIRNPAKVRKLLLLCTALPRVPPFISLLRTKLSVSCSLATGPQTYLHNGVENQAAMTPSLVDDYLKPFHEDPICSLPPPQVLREFDLRPTLRERDYAQLRQDQIPTLQVTEILMFLSTSAKS